MVAKNEIERIEMRSGIDFMPANPWEFDINLNGVPEDVLARLLVVIGQVAKFEPSTWPDDDYWRAILPGWMRVTLPELTPDESDRLLQETPRDQWDRLPWEFGSWLDAIRDRGWRWWGYCIQGQSATIVLHIAMFPERIDAFRQILHATGATIVAERYSRME